MSDCLVTSLEGNRQWLDGGAMFGNAPREMWKRWYPPDEFGRIELACRSLLVECDGKKILCETGIGNFLEPKLAERYGVQQAETHVLLQSLASLGIKHEDIDCVVLSHLHFDHAGGLLPGYGQSGKVQAELLFPNAQYLVGRRAFDRAVQPHMRDRASFIAGLTEKLEKSGRLILVDGEEAPIFRQRLQFFYSDGHTPGQMHAVFLGSENKLIFAGDLIPGTTWLHLPLTMGYDRFPERLIEEKAELYQRIADTPSLFFYTHDPKFALSRLGKDGKGRFQAVEPVEQFTRMRL